MCSSPSETQHHCDVLFPNDRRSWCAPVAEQVYIIGCYGGLKHVRLDAENGGMASITTYSTTPTDVGGSDWNYLFRIYALEDYVVAARISSDEVWTNLHTDVCAHAGGLSLN